MSDTEKTVAFIDAAPAGPNSQSSRSGYALQGTIMAGAQSTSSEHDAIPSYMSILNSGSSVPEKMKMLVATTKQNLDRQFSSLRPWSEFFDRSFFASPAGSSEAITRLNANLRHFSSNYIVLSLVCSSYILLINLAFSLCVVAAVGFYMYVRACSQDLVARGDTSGKVYLFRRPFSVTQLYAILAVFAILTFWLFNGGSVVFWLVLTSLGVSCGHAVMRRPPLSNDDFTFA